MNILFCLNLDNRDKNRIQIEFRYTMNIQLFKERVSLESRILQLCVRQRQWLTEERFTKLEQLIPRQQAILAEAVAERQKLLDNPNCQYWRPANRINPHMQHFTQLRHLPFCVCKPDLDTALSSIRLRIEHPQYDAKLRIGQGVADR